MNVDFSVTNGFVQQISFQLCLCLSKLSFETREGPGNIPSPYRVESLLIVSRGLYRVMVGSKPYSGWDDVALVTVTRWVTPIHSKLSVRPP